MSVSPALRFASRSAYRNVLRAASFTFAGDAPVLQAFRDKIRSDIAQQDIQNPESFQKQVHFIQEIAHVLRKNIVQGERLNKLDAQGDVYRLRLTQYTELGDNSSIKKPDPMMSSRSARRTNKEISNSIPSDAVPLEGLSQSTTPIPPKYFSALKRVHKNRIIPNLIESDLNESFVRGSGPGGQSINKTENNVQLVHKPTGIRVSCQETRSLSQNRKLARKRLLEKLDKLENPGLSKEEMKAAKQRERERQKKKKARKKATMRILEGQREQEELV